MNVTRHGGVFYRKDSQTSNRIGESLAAHFSRLDPCGTIRSARMRDVVMAGAASSSLSATSQPLAAEDNVLLTWDGRLDNGSRIAADSKLEPHETCEDAALVARAYSALGSDLWPALVGDYAVACWDSVTRQLYLARDPFGTRPLYYYIDDSTAIWCSELTYLSEFLGEALQLDDEFIASYLLASETPERTPYRNISSVRPGYVTIIGKEEVSHRQLWNAASCAEVRLGSDAEYEARFHELFAQSVRRRLRIPGAAVAELSGGLDSSSVVCMAHQLSGEDREAREKITTVSYLYDGSETADEREFIAEVERLRGVDTHFIRDHNAVPVSSAPEAPRPCGLDLFRDTYEALQEIIERANASILLSGFGGDEITLNEEIFCPDLISLLKGGKPLAAFRSTRRWAQARKTTTARLLWTSGIWPLLPRRLQRALAPRTLFPKSWMGPALLARRRMSEQQVDQGPRRLSDVAQRRQCKALNRAVSFTSQCYHREQGCGDVTYPFLDRCLIDFMIGIPADQKLRPTENRSIHRRGMKGVLPDKIRLRKTKQGADEPLLRALSRNGSALLEIFRNAEVHKRGYIEGEAFLGELNRARHGICGFSAALARVLSLELWLQAYSRQGRPAKGGSPVSAVPVAQHVPQPRRAVAHVPHHEFVEAATERR